MTRKWCKNCREVTNHWITWFFGVPTSQCSICKR